MPTGNCGSNARSRRAGGTSRGSCCRPLATCFVARARPSRRLLRMNEPADDSLPDPEDLIPVTELPSYLPRRNGRKVHVGTCWRYVLTGKQGIKMRSVV